MCLVRFLSCCFLSSSSVKTSHLFEGNLSWGGSEGKEMDSLYILNTGVVRAISYDKLARSSGSSILS